MISMVARGSQRVRWISRGLEKRWPMNTGAVNFFPRDGEQHTFVLTREPCLDMPVFLIPDTHFRECMNSDHCEPRTDLRQNTFPDDAVLQWCLHRLGGSYHADPDNTTMHREEAGRKLVLRLIELSGGGRPPWGTDASGFERRTLTHLVDYIDSHLHPAPSLSEMALLVGLSPSHFAKKFRHSTGLSLHRFINRRRINRSLHMLKVSQAPLSHVALDLGFSSQSHFTRLFSELTGMTPAKYQKQFRRTVG